jgi:5'-3' exonuclease
MVKVTLNGYGELYSLDEVIAGLDLTIHQFQMMCIAAGCDYLKNVYGFGIRKAYKSIKEHGSDFLQFMSNKIAPVEYMDTFNTVFAVYNHQTVFDIDTCETVQLKECSRELSVEIQHLCGKYPFQC